MFGGGGRGEGVGVRGRGEGVGVRGRGEGVGVRGRGIHDRQWVREKGEGGGGMRGGGWGGKLRASRHYVSALRRWVSTTPGRLGLSGCPLGHPD